MAKRIIDNRDYWFDESYGAIPNNNYTPQPTIQPTNDIANTDTNTTGSVRQRTQQRTTSNNSSSDIVTIGTRSFGDAFKQARNAGLDKFRWKGRVYGTKYANEVGNNNTSNRRTTTKPAAKSNIKPTKQPRTTNTNNNTNTSRTTYTRDNNGYAQLPEVTVTAPAKQTRPTNTSRTTNTNSTPRRYNLPQIQGYNSRFNNTSNGTSLNQTLDDTFRMINQVNSRKTSFYDARKAAQAQGKKSFVYNGNTYSSYGATSSSVGKYGKKKK